MKLENQVASLELSKKLYELGVRRDSYFAHVWFLHKDAWEINPSGCGGIAAYTVAELGEMLPAYLMHNGERITLIIDFYSDDVSVAYLSHGYRDTDIVIRLSAGTEVNARAEMLVYLIENELITLEDVNNAGNS